LKNPEIFERLGVEPPKGVLLYGPPGCGKTLLAKAVANESDANFFLVNGPELTSKFYGETEKRIRDLFEDAEKNAPSIIFIDEIDAIAPKREETYGEVERRMVSQMLTVMDGLKSRGKVIVIGATNRPNSLDPALRRPGRFDREISIGVPNKAGRLKILKIHTRNMPLTKDVNLEHLAEITHGFVGADLEALAKEAAMNVLRKVLPDMKLKKDEVMAPELLARLKVQDEDFRAALRVVRPSAMREVLIEAPNVRWEDIGGLDDLKQQLKEAVELPLKSPQSFTRLGIKPPKGILMYGPPGCGKTLLAKAVAKESEANFISVKGPELLNKYVGESEKGVRKIFEKARQVAPCIIFFDEIDSIAPRRGMDLSNQVTERVVNAILAEIDGLEDLNDVVILAASNRPDLIDPALLRPGRFDRIIATSLPDKKTRLEILKIHTKNMPLAKNVNLETLAERTDNFNGADIQGICREAALHALRNDPDVKEISMKDFEKILEKTNPSVREGDLKRYKEIEEAYIRTARAAQVIPKPSYLG
ncbi:MAG: CDC48 family AAA ATPase, partial [Nanoarchaeota archaeon]